MEHLIYHIDIFYHYLLSAQFLHDIFYFFRDYIFLMNGLFLLILIFLEKKKPVSTLFWVTLLILMPYAGFILYLFFGLTFRKARIIKKFYGKTLLDFNSRIDHKRDSLESISNWKKLVEFLEVSQAGILATYSNYKLFTTGVDFFANLTEDIRNAKKYIHMEYFIFKDDEVGNNLYNAIISKAKEGVPIKLILDGTNQITIKKIDEFRKIGIDVELFYPSFFRCLKIANIRANYRDHRKISIIDGDIAYVGGFNIGNDYIGKGRLGHWRDTAVRLEGNIINELEKEFSSSWNFIQKNRKEKFLYPLFTNEITANDNYAQLVSSGPNFQLRTARDNFLKLCIKATKSIYIETPYFVPDEPVLEALKMSALAGVSVKVIIPDKPDHFFVYWINQSYARELAEYGVKFYRYKKGFIHSKVVIIDQEVVSLGTTNFDYRSFYNNFEINVNFYGGEIVKENIKAFTDDLQNSSRLTFDEKDSKNIIIRCKESVFRLLAPMF